MKPVICFYKDNQYLYSEDYNLKSYSDHKSLKSIEKEFLSHMKVIKINFDQSKNQKNLITTNPVDVFILNSHEILNNEQLKKKLSAYQLENDNTLQFESLVSKEKFISQVQSIKEDIANGRYYQINIAAPLKTKLKNRTDGLSLFNHYSHKVHAPYAAYLPLGENEIICLSPELFLKKEQTTVTTRPIKGTLITHSKISQLADSEKEAAELSMIVDLLRNDLNAIATDPKQGSKVNFHRKILDVGYTQHTYSEIEVQSQKTLPDILQATFPGGSISGCPKLESLIKINETEEYSRDFYTGSIGWWQNNDFSLNIAIRSFIKNNHEMYYYAGCGIVYDSDSDSEWLEYLTKSSFINIQKKDFKVLDTLLITKNGFTYFDEHVERTSKALKHYKSTNDVTLIYKELEKQLLAEIDSTKSYRVSLEFPIQPNLTADSVIVRHLEYHHENKIYLLEKKYSGPINDSIFKINDRKIWDELFKSKSENANDVVVINMNGYLTETSMFNLYYKLNDQIYTPPLSDGCINGVFRSHHLKKAFIEIDSIQYKISERSLHESELSTVDIYVGNSVRGLFKAKIL